MDDLSDLLQKAGNPISCFYRVSESIIGINEDPDEQKEFDWDEDFTGTDLLLSRDKAIAYYGNRLIKFNLEGFSEDFFSLSYSSPTEFIIGKNYAYSIKLLLVVQYSASDFNEYNILGEDEDDMKEGRSFEKEIYSNLGFSDDQLSELGRDLFYEEGLIDAVSKFSIIDSEFEKLPLKEKLKHLAEMDLGNEPYRNYVKKRILRIE